MVLLSIRVINRVDVRLTRWDGEKPEKNKAIPMRPSYIVVNITDRHVDGPILIMTCSNGDRGFVAAKYDWYKHGSDCVRILCNQVL